jgi:hypothetical protein
MVNALGSVDVDIILDEGPDTINAMADTHDTLKEVLPAIAAMLTPQQASAAIEILIETSAMPSEMKKKFKDASQPQQQPPDPALEMAKKLELAKTDAEAKDKAASAGLKDAQRQKTVVETQLLPAEGRARHCDGPHAACSHGHHGRAGPRRRASGPANRADERPRRPASGGRDSAAPTCTRPSRRRQFQGQQSEADRAAAAAGHAGEDGADTKRPA